MQTRFYIILGLAVLVSFVGGFMLANSLNRAEIDALTSLQKSSAELNPASTAANEPELSEKEIEEKIKEAERNAGDFLFQKGLGLALYRYAAFKGDQKRLEDVEVLLGRAYKVNPDDYQVIVAFANINFDLGRIKKEESFNLRARELYQKALRKNPKDAQVLGDLGATFIETASPSPKEAMPYLDQSLKLDGRNEKVVVELVKTHTLLKNRSKAEEYLLKLKELNPKHPEIGTIEANLKAGGKE